MKKVKGSESGQSLLEFALILPLLLVIFVATINFGEVLAANLLVQNIARNGARVASLGTDNVDQQISYAITQVKSQFSENAFLKAAACSSSSKGCLSQNPEISIPVPTDSSPYVNVQISYGVQLWGPISSAILGNPFIIHSTVSMMEEPSSLQSTGTSSSGSGGGSGSDGSGGSSGDGGDGGGSGSGWCQYYQWVCH